MSKATQAKPGVLAQLETLMRGTGHKGWEVSSELTYPRFNGQVSEGREEGGHGVYTTDELFRHGYCLEGWVEAGYTPMAFNYEGDFEGAGFNVVMTHGPIRVVITMYPDS